MPINAVTLSTTKTIGAASLMPGLTLLLGGILAWKLWQQHQQAKNAEQKQVKLSKRLDDLEKQWETKNSTEERKQKTAESVRTSQARHSRSSSSLQSSNSPSNNPKNGLFEQLISDNIALREAH